MPQTSPMGNTPYQLFFGGFGSWAFGILQISKRIQVWKSLDSAGRASPGNSQGPWTALCTAKGKECCGNTKAASHCQGILELRHETSLKGAEHKISQDGKIILGYLQFPPRTWEPWVRSGGRNKASLVTWLSLTALYDTIQLLLF